MGQGLFEQRSCGSPGDLCRLAMSPHPASEGLPAATQVAKPSAQGAGGPPVRRRLDHPRALSSARPQRRGMGHGGIGRPAAVFKCFPHGVPTKGSEASGAESVIRAAADCRPQHRPQPRCGIDQPDGYACCHPHGPQGALRLCAVATAFSPRCCGSGRAPPRRGGGSSARLHCFLVLTTAPSLPLLRRWAGRRGSWVFPGPPPHVLRLFEPSFFFRSLCTCSVPLERFLTPHVTCCCAPRIFSTGCAPLSDALRTVVLELFVRAMSVALRSVAAELVRVRVPTTSLRC